MENIEVVFSILRFPLEIDNNSYFRQKMLRNIFKKLSGGKNCTEEDKMQ